MNALILSGGGARGAYEVGVLSYLFEELPQKAGFCPRFDIVCGSSVGAINAAFFASGVHETKGMIQNLREAWEDLTPEKVYRTSLRKVLSLPLWAARGTSPSQSALFDITPLIQLLKKRVAWQKLASNVARGPLHAMTVSATDLDTGVTAVFTHRKGGGVHPHARDPYVTALPTVIAPKHVLASAAIPLLFPPVLLKNRFYYDGSIRHSTPISPALRLGATKIFIVSLRSPLLPDRFDLQEETQAINPNFLYMAGKVFNAFMLDRLQYDIDRLDRFNAILDMGEKAFGKDFVEVLNQTVVPLRGVPYRKVNHCVIAPSQDLGDIAAEITENDKKRRKKSSLLKALQFLSKTKVLARSDLLSYVLFDAPYTRKLVELGRTDARAREKEILSFFAEETTSPATAH